MGSLRDKSFALHTCAPEHDPACKETVVSSGNETKFETSEDPE